jgi:hypothetical protein
VHFSESGRGEALSEGGVHGVEFGGVAAAPHHFLLSDFPLESLDGIVDEDGSAEKALWVFDPLDFVERELEDLEVERKKGGLE